MRKIITAIAVLLLSFGASAQENTVLIAHNNYLVGAVRNGKWLKYTEVSATTGKPSKFFAFDSFKNEKPSELYGMMELLGCGANYFYFDKTAKIPESIFDENSLKPILAMSANASWNPLPRRAQNLALSNKTYQKIALDFLKTKRINAKSIKLENAFSVDLENDGSKEIFLEATSYTDKSTTARRGDYSFVMMRKTIGGKANDFLIEGEFHPVKPEAGDYISEFDLSAFADLNGDGKIEVVLEATYSYGGSSSAIYESSNNALNEVLGVECGD